MSVTMFAAYDPDDELTPRFFPLADTSDSSAAIATRAYDLGVRMGKSDLMREVVSISDCTALVHFGTLVRFLDEPPGKVDAYYAIGASDDDKDALVRMAEFATLDSTFMSGMWDHRARKRGTRHGRPTPEQEHLYIALVTDLLNPGRYAATTVDQGATA